MSYVMTENYAGGLIGDGPTTARSTAPMPIRNGLNEMGSLLTRLVEVTAHLEKRLQPVLKPAPPSGESGKNPAVPHAICSPLAGEFRRLVQQANLIHRELAGLLARLEL